MDMPDQNHWLSKAFKGRLRWALVIWMLVVSAVAFLDRVNVSIAGQAIQRDHGLTDVQLGWVFSAFLIGYALFQVPGGWLADRFGPRLVISAGVFWWSLLTTLTALVPAGMATSVGMLIGTRFVLGLGEAVLFPSSNRLVSAWIPSSERGLANGLIFAGVGAGAGVTPPFIIFILSRWGWQMSFYISALLGLAVGIVWFILVRDRPDQHPLVGRDELCEIDSGLKAVTVVQQEELSLLSIVKDGNVVAITCSYFAYGYTSYIFFTWFFIYLSRVRGLDLKSSAFFSMLPFIAMACAAPVGGWISDRIARTHGRRSGRCGVAVFGLSLASLFIVLATQVESARLASVVLTGGAGAIYLAQSAYWSVSADIAGPSAGRVSGLMNMGAQIGGAVTASLTPWIAQRFGWTSSFVTAACVCFAGALAWFFVNPEVQILTDSSAGRRPPSNNL